MLSRQGASPPVQITAPWHQLYAAGGVAASLITRQKLPPTTLRPISQIQ
jgi:hypothetical protein